MRRFVSRSTVRHRNRSGWLCACLAIVLGLGPTAPAAYAASRKADLVVRGAHIITIDDALPVATAMAIKGDRIVAVGSARDVETWIGETTHILPLNGKTVVPGFIDAHGHFLGLGESRMILDLTTADTWDAIVKQVAKAARTTPAGRWIVGRGWHQNKWTRTPVPNIDGCPVHDALSRVTPDNPVLLTHASGHMCIVNQYAMNLAHMDQETVAPAGGQILHAADGQPTGVLRENAMALVRRHYTDARNRRAPTQKRRDQLTAIRLAADECLRFGITSFQDAGSSFATIDLFKQLARDQRLPVRLWVMILEDNRSLRQHMDDYRVIGYGNQHLTVRAVKRLVDGARRATASDSRPEHICQWPGGLLRGEDAAEWELTRSGSVPPLTTSRRWSASKCHSNCP